MGRVKRKRYKIKQKFSDGNLQRKYDAASTKGGNTQWITDDSSPIDEVSTALNVLVKRSRDLDRNSAIANAANRTLVSLILGRSGMRLQVSCQNENLKNRIKSLTNDLFDSTGFDVEGRNNFMSSQILAIQAAVVSGNCFILRRYTNRKSGIPLKIQIIEADYLDTDIDRVRKNGNRIVNGIEFDKNQNRVAYWFFANHPANSSSGTQTSRRVDAEKVIHIYDQERPGQILGVPKGSAVFNLIKLLSDWEDATLQRQRSSASVSAFIEDAFDSYIPRRSNEDLKRDGGESPAEEEDEEEEDEEEFEISFQPNTVSEIPAGKKITFNNPPGVVNFKEFSGHILHRIARGYGLTYEALTGDLEKVSFVSGRIGQLDMHRQITKWQKNIVIATMCDGILTWVKQALESLGLDLSGVKFSWSIPKREIQDREKEFDADIKGIRSGLYTLSEVVESYGDDFEEKMNRHAKDLKFLDSLGLTFDTDPRKTNKSGQQQPRDADEDKRPEDN